MLAFLEFILTNAEGHFRPYFYSFCIFKRWNSKLEANLVSVCDKCTGVSDVGVWVLSLFDTVLCLEPAVSPMCGHYHSQVLYQVEGFVDKNNDLLYRDLSQAMWKAGHSLIKSLFPEGNPAKVNLKRPPTAGSQFKASVATLMSNLQTKNPNYIRCFWDLSSYLRALHEAPSVTGLVDVGFVLFCFSHF